MDLLQITGKLVHFPTLFTPALELLISLPIPSPSAQRKFLHWVLLGYCGMDDDKRLIMATKDDVVCVVGLGVKES